MPAAITDKLRKTYNAANPNVARVTATRAIAGTTLTCDNLAGWPTDTAVDFSTYKVNASNVVVPGTQIDWKGIVSGNNIGTLTRITGAADGGSAIGDVVEANPTGSWANDLVSAVLVHSNQDGTLKTDATTTTVIKDAAVTTAKVADAAITPDKWTNPYKFSVYLAADQLIGSSTYTKVTLNTELFDTNNNFDNAANFRFTATVAGYYQVNSQVGLSVAGLTNLTGSTAAIYKNGANYIQSGSFSGTGNAATTPRVVINDLIHLNVGDYLEIWAIIYEGGRSVAGGRGATFMSAHLVSKA